MTERMTERATVPITGTWTPALPLVLHVIPTTWPAAPSARPGPWPTSSTPPGHPPPPRAQPVRRPAEVEADLSLDHPGGDTPGVGFDPRLVVRLRAALDRLDPAVVVAHGSEPLKYLVPAMIGHRRPLVYYAIGTYSGADRRISSNCGGG